MSHYQLQIRLQSKQLEVSVCDRHDGRVLLQSSIAAELGPLRLSCKGIIKTLGRLRQRTWLPQDLLELKSKCDHLTRQTIGPVIADFLDKHLPETLQISVSWELRWLPVQLLRAGDEFLCLMNATGVVWEAEDSASPLNDLAGLKLTTQDRNLPRQAGIEARLLADSTFELVYAQNEARTVSYLWAVRPRHIRCPAEVHSSLLITRQEALQRLAEADWLHFCGHAAPDTDNLRSWKFIDGLLTANDLRDARTVAPKFLFVSACGSAAIPMTNVGEPTLMEQLLRQGCEHFVGTLTPIFDDQCLPFVEEFYTQVLKGKSVGECIRRARKTQIKELGESNLTWATFTLTGDPRDVLLPRTASVYEQGMRDLRGHSEGEYVSGLARTEITEPRTGEQFPLICGLCGRQIRTRHGLRTELSSGSPEIACRQCYRDRRFQSPAPSTFESLAQEPPPVLEEIRDQESHFARLTPADKSSSSVYERQDDYLAKWQQSIHQCPSFTDPLSQQVVRVELKWTAYRTSSGRPRRAYRATGRLLDRRSTYAIPNHVLLFVEGENRVASDRSLTSSTIQSTTLGIDSIQAALAALPIEDKREGRILGLVSAAGWDDAAKEYVISESYANQFGDRCSVVLIDLQDHCCVYPPHDLQVLPWVPLLDPENETHKTARIRAEIERRLPLTVCLSDSDLNAIIPAPSGVILRAMQQAAVQFRLHLDELPRFGWVLSQE